MYDRGASARVPAEMGAVGRTGCGAVTGWGTASGREAPSGCIGPGVAVFGAATAGTGCR